MAGYRQNQIVPALVAQLESSVAGSVILSCPADSWYRSSVTHM
jgi:hypothetical protein